jgi:hypothetical protein
MNLRWDGRLLRTRPVTLDRPGLGLNNRQSWLEFFVNKQDRGNGSNEGMVLLRTNNVRWMVGRSKTTLAVGRVNSPQTTYRRKSNRDTITDAGPSYRRGPSPFDSRSPLLTSV